MTLEEFANDLTEGRAMFSLDLSHSIYVKEMLSSMIGRYHEMGGLPVVGYGRGMAISHIVYVGGLRARLSRNGYVPAYTIDIAYYSFQSTEALSQDMSGPPPLLPRELTDNVPISSMTWWLVTDRFTRDFLRTIMRWARYEIMFRGRLP